MDWTRIGEIAGVVGAILGFGVKVGKMSQRIRDAEQGIEGLAEKLNNHSGRLAAGAEAFARIDEKLVAVKDGQDRVEKSVQEGLKEMRSIILRHIDGGER